MYIIYDGRAILGNTDDAAVLVCCSTNGEAREYAGEHDDVICCYSNQKLPGNMLGPERHEWDWYADQGFVEYEGDLTIEGFCEKCQHTIYSKEHHLCKELAQKRKRK